MSRRNNMAPMAPAGPISSYCFSVSRRLLASCCRPSIKFINSPHVEIGDPRLVEPLARNLPGTDQRQLPPGSQFIHWWNLSSACSTKAKDMLFVSMVHHVHRPGFRKSTYTAKKLPTCQTSERPTADQVPAGSVEPSIDHLNHTGSRGITRQPFSNGCSRRESRQAVQRVNRNHHNPPPRSTRVGDTRISRRLENATLW